jgi:hypothetical protein
MYFNQECLEKDLIQKYTKIKNPNTTREAKYTEEKETRNIV